MAIISESYESFNDQKVEEIVIELIRNREIFNVGIGSALHYKIDRVVNKLGYAIIDPMKLGRSHNLLQEDYFKVRDKIWDYLTSGILAPGRNYEEPSFPYLHLTEKGKKILQDKLSDMKEQ